MYAIIHILQNVSDSSNWRYEDWGHGFMAWPMWPMMIAGSIVMFLFWALVIVGFVFLIRWLIRTGDAAGKRAEESALDILNKRYARGEISKEEYQEKREHIGKQV